MVQYKRYNFICPKCGKPLLRGFRRFGPSHVRCKYCNEVLDTGLADWSEVPSGGAKLGLVLAEFFNPSWIGIPGSFGYVANIFAFGPLAAAAGGMVAVIPLLIVVSLAGSVGQGADTPPVVQAIATILMVIAIAIWSLGLFAYPLALIWRIVKLVRESRTYTQTHLEPVWGR